MACVGLKNQNSFGLLASLDPPPPNELSQVLSRNSCKKTAARDPEPAKSQRNTDQHCDLEQPRKPVPRQNGNTKPRFADARDRNNVVREDRGCNRDPAPLPPRLRNHRTGSRGAPQGFCGPAPRPCSGGIDPCLTSAPSCGNELLNMQLKQIMIALQNPKDQPPTTCPQTSASIPPPACDPIPSKKDTPPIPIPPQANQTAVKADNVVITTTTCKTERSTPTQRTVGRKQPPRTPEVASGTSITTTAQIDPSKNVDASLSPPPGSSKPSIRGRRHNNRRGSTRPPANGERRLNEVAEDTHFERHNGPVATSSAISPPPPGASDLVVKLPANKDAQPVQPVPSSPTTTASSLAGDLSGDSLVLRSDTTFTSVDSNVSNTAPPRHKTYVPTCRNWMKGRPCFLEPCRYLHPERPMQPANPAVQSTQSPSAPPGLARPKQPIGPATQSLPAPPGLARPKQPAGPAVQPTQPPSAPPGLARLKQPAGPAMQPTKSLSAGVVQTSARMSDQKNNSVPQKHDPPNGTIELPQRPEPLYATTVSDHIKVRFDQGFEVRDVVTGFESRWVHLGNIDSSVTLAAVNDLLGPYKVDNINLPESSGKPVIAKVQFASAADAIQAVTDLNGIEIAHRTITAKVAINNSVGGSTTLTDTDAQLIWECPFRVGYAGYDTLKEAKVALASLNGFSMEYLVVSAELYEGLPCVGAYNVIFKHLPASVTESDLRKFASSKAVMLGRPNYLSLDKAVKSIRSRLEEYGTVTAFDILPPPYKDGMVKAWVRFTSPAEARAAQDDLDHRRPKAIGHTTLSCRHVVSISHVLNAAGYKKMREDIGWLRWSWQRRYGPGVSIRERIKENANDDVPVYIKLSSEHPELLSGLKYEFEQLLHGETVTLEKKPLWDDFLISQAGHAYIAQVHAQFPGVQIQVQNNRRVISLWGPIGMRHRARQDIVRKVMELKAQQFWKIPLTGKILGYFCSAELSTLQGLLGMENCVLDISKRVLVVRGNDAAFRTACQAVQDVQSRQGDEASSSDAICPVCFGEAIVPVSLPCGHQWCRACLSGYLTSAVENKMFPLRCLGNDATCTQCIPLGLSRKLLSVADFNAVIESAFWVYVHSRPDEFHHCPTPDCTQVYRSAPQNAVLQCPSCLVRICAACRIEYHDGMTCEERDVAEDKLFNEWTSNNDVKSCPGCKAPIERSEGCNHMTCTRCQTHICWECLATFPRGQGIYDHMRIQHGGIGL